MILQGRVPGRTELQRELSGDLQRLALESQLGLGQHDEPSGRKETTVLQQAE